MQYLRLLAILGTLTIIFSCYLPVAQADDWQIPCALSNEQKQMLASLTGLPASSVADQITACRIYGSEVLLVRYTDGRMGTFGIGEPELKAFSTKEEDHSGTEQEHQLFIELEKIWLEAGLGDNLSSEDLARSDQLVREIFARTPSEQVQLADYEFLGMRGNRYRSVVEGLSPTAGAF